MVKWLPYHNDHSHIAMSPLPYHNHHSTFIVSPYCQITITIPQSLIAIFYGSISPLSYCCIAILPHHHRSPSAYYLITMSPSPYCHMAIPYCHITITILPCHLHYMGISPLYITITISPSLYCISPSPSPYRNHHVAISHISMSRYHIAISPDIAITISLCYHMTITTLP